MTAWLYGCVVVWLCGCVCVCVVVQHDQWSVMQQPCSEAMQPDGTNIQTSQQPTASQSRLNSLLEMELERRKVGNRKTDRYRLGWEREENVSGNVSKEMGYLCENLSFECEIIAHASDVSAHSFSPMLLQSSQHFPYVQLLPKAIRNDFVERERERDKQQRREGDDDRWALHSPIVNHVKF